MEASMALRYLNSPISPLIAVFIAWKAFLLALAAGSCIGPCYDSSGFILNQVHQGSGLNLFTRLSSWDAIYFLQNARRGYVFEQEWAFGAGLPTLISLLSRVLDFLHLGGHGNSEALLGTIVSHSSHLLSALALHQLSIVIWRDPKLSFLSAFLHIISPAGLFLSAPYQESTFALLSFVGYLLFAQGCRQDRQSIGRGVCVVLAGIVFGLATTFRSNGILNGVLFVFEATSGAGDLVRYQKLTAINRLVFVGLGGICVAAGLVVPQMIAYQRFCSGEAGILRPWCTWTVPSIYSFVQDRYWDNGAFRYWTVSNIPLFILAGPMVFIMLRSGISYLLGNRLTYGSNPQPATEAGGNDVHGMVKCMAFIQATLAVLVTVNHHTQIITRLSSGYPVWYWWLASSLQQGGESAPGRRVVIFLIMYASIQTVLFASFLPPA